ncbi:MAG: 16S rRNA (cytidine(1402)-2'-O)-methyltransferase [Patescibacteria group bacterium]|jgi:16S rRNA (cytidine1402-2'-O)-methyltransferase
MKLYIVATPIGNLQDITLRALEILKSVPLIICEDTRTSQKLLRAYEIESRLESYHQHSKPEKVKYILDLLDEVGEAALITDAGTPGISDPGNMLIAEAVKKFGEGCEIIPIPGPSAIIAALSISGFPTDKFSFFGFMPHKKGKETTIKNILNNKETSIFYESTHRIIKTLEKIKEFDHKRQIIVCRELTKKFETVYRGTVEEVLHLIETGNSKGEFVVVIHS